MNLQMILSCRLLLIIKRDMKIEEGNQKPDELIPDMEERIIFIIQDAQYSSTNEVTEIVEIAKILKYRVLREGLRKRYPEHQVRQLNFTTEIRETINEYR